MYTMNGSFLNGSPEVRKATKQDIAVNWAALFWLLLAYMTFIWLFLAYLFVRYSPNLSWPAAVGPDK